MTPLPHVNWIMQMKTFLSIILIGFLSSSVAFAGNVNPEQEVRDFLAEYKEGVSRRDVDFLERVLSDDYVFSGPSGKMTTRAQALKYFQQQRDNPDYKSISLEHLNEKVHLVGNIALVTNDWISVTSPIDSTNTEPTTSKGRHTGVLERSEGRWMVVAEHDSEQTLDDEWMVSGVVKAGREYNALMLRLNSGRAYAELESSGDIAALSRFLADEYTFTSADGVIFNKAEDIERYKSNTIRVEAEEFIGQNVRTIDNSAAVATGEIRRIGTNIGKPFDITERYTTTWAFYDGRWQITANHTSTVKR